MFAEGNIECVKELLKPSKRVLKEGISVKRETFEQRVDLWNRIEMNYDSYLDEKCGTFLKDLDQHFCSLFDVSLLILAISFREKKESFMDANKYSDEEIELFQKIELYNPFEILSADDIKKKLIQKDSKVLDLLKDYYVVMDSWVDKQLENPELRITLRYYLKQRWDSYKKKLNQAVNSLVEEVDWLKTLTSSWEQEKEEKSNEIIATVEKRVEDQIKTLKAEKDRADEQIKTINIEKTRVEEEARKTAIEKEVAEKQVKELAAENKSIGERIKELAAEKASSEGKGSRYVKLADVKQYELNFIGRLEHRLGDTVTFSGKTYKVENLKEDKNADTSRFGEIYRLSERDVKNLPENRSLVGNLTEKKLNPFGKKQKYYLKALFLSRVEEYAKTRYDTTPLEQEDLNVCLADSRDEAKERGEWVLLCLASPTGFETKIHKYISSEDFHRNFLAKYLSVCLLDLETGEQLYNPHDEVAKEFAKLCELETDREKSEKLKLSVRKKIEEGFLLNNYVVLEDIAKVLENEPTIKPAFYEYAREKGLNIGVLEDIGPVMMK